MSLVVIRQTFHHTSNSRAPVSICAKTMAKVFVLLTGAFAAFHKIKFRLCLTMNLSQVAPHFLNILSLGLITKLLFNAAVLSEYKVQFSHFMKHRICAGWNTVKKNLHVLAVVSSCGSDKCLVENVTVEKQISVDCVTPGETLMLASSIKDIATVAKMSLFVLYWPFGYNNNGIKKQNFFTKTVYWN